MKWISNLACTETFSKVQNLSNFTIFPFWICWKRPNLQCIVPHSIAAHRTRRTKPKRERERGIGKVISWEILKITKCLIPVGSHKLPTLPSSLKYPIHAKFFFKRRNLFPFGHTSSLGGTATLLILMPEKNSKGYIYISCSYSFKK